MYVCVAWLYTQHTFQDVADREKETSTIFLLQRKKQQSDVLAPGF